MKNPLKSDTSASLGLLLARLPVGVLFAIAGYNKLSAGVGGFVSSSLGNVPSQVPREWGTHYLQGVPYAELTVGALLVLGLLTRVAGFVASFMLVTFIIGMNMAWAGGAPHPNLTYLAVTLMVFLVGPGKFSLDALLFKKKSKAFAD